MKYFKLKIMINSLFQTIQESEIDIKCKKMNYKKKL